MNRSALEELISKIQTLATMATRGQVNLPTATSALEQVVNLFKGQQTQAIDRSLTPEPFSERLRREVLKNTSYTPQASTYLQNVPVNTLVNASAPWAGTYNNDAITINPRHINPNNMQFSQDALRHEFVHALDAQANGEYIPASFPRENNSIMNSYGVWDAMSPQQQRQFVENYGFSSRYPQNERTSNIEGLAYWGQGGQNVLLNRNLVPYYKSAYIPATPVNYNLSKRGTRGKTLGSK